MSGCAGGILMEIRYFTKKGSIYIQKIEEGQEFWIRKEKDGQTSMLAGAVHISYKRLQELIREYPSSLLDKTYCFGVDVEKEFLEDAKKETFIGDSADIRRDKTVICFLLKTGEHYRLGCSSLVERTEEAD
jgi:hypothetical protein